jgi:hypothetical protein
MAMQAPTRITIEVHPPEPGTDGAQPVVRVVPEGLAGAAPAAGTTAPNGAPNGAQTPVRAAMAVEPREEIPTPAAYEPGPCRCLDDEDCAADHANE